VSCSMTGGQVNPSAILPSFILILASLVAMRRKG